MSRILLQSSIDVIRERPHFRWKRVVSRPEGRRGVAVQRDVVLPAAWSRRAFSARASSLPASTSASSWRSQAAQSNSRNHARNYASSSGESARTSCSIFSTLPMTFTLRPVYHLAVTGRSAPAG